MHKLKSIASRWRQVCGNICCQCARAFCLWCVGGYKLFLGDFRNVGINLGLPVGNAVAPLLPVKLFRASVNFVKDDGFEHRVKQLEWKGVPQSVYTGLPNGV